VAFHFSAPVGDAGAAPGRGAPQGARGDPSGGTARRAASRHDGLPRGPAVQGIARTSVRWSSRFEVAQPGEVAAERAAAIRPSARRCRGASPGRGLAHGDPRARPGPRRAVPDADRPCRAGAGRRSRGPP